MPASFLRCDQFVPGLITSLVAEGVDPTTLKQVNRQLNMSVSRSGRALVAAQMQVPVDRLPYPDQLQGEPGESFVKLSSALVFGREHVLAAPVHRQLQTLATAAGRTERLALRFAPSLPPETDILDELVHLPASVANLPRDQRAAALAAYTRDRVWGRVHAERPRARNWVERVWLEKIETTADRKDTWRGDDQRHSLDVYLHFGVVSAALFMSSMPKVVAGSIVGAYFVSALALLEACAAFLIFALPDSVSRLRFQLKYLNRTDVNAQPRFFSRSDLENAWPELANPFQEQLIDASFITVQFNFDAIRHLVLQDSVRLHTQGAQVSGLRGNVRPFGVDFPLVDVDLPPPPRVLLDAYWKKLVVRRHNARLRPYLPSEHLMVALANRSGFGGSPTWSSYAKALAQTHRRRDAPLDYPGAANLT